MNTDTEKLIKNWQDNQQITLELSLTRAQWFYVVEFLEKRLEVLKSDHQRLVEYRDRLSLQIDEFKTLINDNPPTHPPSPTEPLP